jgi:SAM-dependent methyltransferase
MKWVSTKLPAWVKDSLRPARSALEGVFYAGHGRFCPVCGKSSRRFKPGGVVPRDDAQCVHCGSLERHRLVWLFIQKKTNLLDGKSKKMLHVAPELCLEPRFRKHLGVNYLTADLLGPSAMVVMDITDIHYADQSFDVIYCSHVLEHVQDDRRAMREFYRVLKNDGWAILLVPVTSERTFEDPSIIDPRERFKIFGQTDHVRRYGPDYVDRLREAGFNVEITRVCDLVNDEEATEMGLASDNGQIYYCTKHIDG